ncbi:hypothetical protein BGZ49_002213 [Haplosporangium sp. Z 27]|nr:hypothetical protein BGZ49_002213 [Haplosporangium sp. Z 27]
MATTIQSTSDVPTTTAPPPTTTVAPPTTAAPSPTTTTSSYVSPTTDPAATSAVSPSPSPSPDQPGSGGGSGGKQTSSRKPATRTSSSIGSTPVPSSGGVGTGNGGNGTGGSIGGDSSNSGSSKSVVGPVVGSIAGVLVLAFIVAVFVMRYRKKNKDRQRRLDVLLDPNGPGQDRAQALGLGGSTNTLGKPRPSSIQNLATKPSGQLEMAAIAGGAAAPGIIGGPIHHADDGYNDYDYQQGYQHVPYAGYQDQYDQYDPYYQQPMPLAQPGAQMPPVGYYPDSPRQRQQLAQQQHHQPYGAGSPSMSHSSAPSPSKPYPQPPHVAGSSPLALYQQATPNDSYERFNKVESSDYAASQSPARNPQIIPDERMKASQQ